jgi:hypothetical protein
MGSIKHTLIRYTLIKIFFPAVLFGLALSPCLFAQSQGTLLGTEIQSLEKKLGRNAGGSSPALSGTERHDALVRLASLQELSGNIEGASQSWAEAALAETALSETSSPGDALSGGNVSLMRGAYCLAAMGEWEKADAAVKKVLLAARPGQALSMARFLSAVISACTDNGNAAGKAVNGGSDGTGALAALLGDPDFSGQKPAICYILWKLSGAESWKTRLLAEFPRSPEGRIAAGVSAPISAAPTAFWLLLPGREGFTLSSASGPAAQGSSIAPVSGQASPQPAPNPAVSSSVSSSSAVGGTATLLQTGLFGREENAKGQADRLRTAGFTPSIKTRQVNGSEYWMVGVPPGQDINQTILRLKDAGFESFPVFE